MLMKNVYFKQLVRRIKYINNIKYLPYLNFSFSNNGEDLDLKCLFNGVYNGFYVDLGCYHPVALSNTFVLHCRNGWRGLNVDATPGVKELFDKKRPNDINVNAAISKKGGGEELLYYMFDNGDINTFDKDFADQCVARGSKLINTKSIKAYTICEILDKYLPPNQKIDLMDIDIENYDRTVVSQMEWDKYKPSVVIIESARDKDDFVSNIMKNAGYVLRCKTVRNDMFIREEILDELVNNTYHNL